MKDITARALNIAQVRGAAYADIRVVSRDTQRVAVKNGKVEALQQDETQGFGVRVIVNGAWGFAASSHLEVHEIERVVNASHRHCQSERARQVTRRGHWRAGRHQRVVRNADQNQSFYRFDERQDQPAVEERMRRCGASRESRSRAREMAFVRENKLFASTEGSLINQEIVESGCGIVALATDLQTGEVQVRSYPNSVGRHQQTRGYEFILEQKLVENAPRVAEEAVALLTADQCPSYDAATIILDSSQLALQIHESCGHPIELDRVLGSEAAYAGTSFLTPEKLGRFRYGSEVGEHRRRRDSARRIRHLRF